MQKEGGLKNENIKQFRSSTAPVLAFHCAHGSRMLFYHQVELDKNRVE